MELIPTGHPFRLTAACAIALAAGSGCVGPLRSPDVASDAVGATGAAEARDLIVFRTEGGPIDAAADVGPRLTRADAVRLALLNDPDLQVALAKLKAAEADAKQARLLPNPVVSVMVRFREGGGEPVITADLTADLLSILQRPRRTQAADRRLRAVSADALTAVIDLVAGVEQAYAAAQSLDAQVAVLADRRALLERLLNIANARLQAGEGTRLDVTTVQGQRVDLEEQIADRHLQRTLKRLALARLIGRPSGQSDWELDAWEPPAPVAGAEADWVSAALSHRPEVRAKLWELAAAGDEQALAAWEVFKGAEIGTEFEKDINWIGGPSISSPLPVFDWGQANRAKAKAAQVQTRHELTKVRRQVVEETRAALATIAQSQAALARVKSDLVPLQEQRRTQAEDMYRAGESDLTQLLVAEGSVQDARERAVLLQEAAVAALSKLHRAVGGHGVAAELAAGPSTAPTQAPPQTAPAQAVPQPSPVQTMREVP